MDDFYENPDPLEGLLDSREHHCCLARFVKSECATSMEHFYLQCFFEPISDEPDLVLKNESSFWRYGLDTYPYFTITGDAFLSLIGEKNYPFVDSELSAAEQAKFIEEKTKNKMILFYPFYKASNKSNIIYKNFNKLGKVRFFDVPNTNPRYFVLPLIDSISYQQLKDGKVISLTSFDRSVYGAPMYLLYQNRLISVDLTFSPHSCFNCQRKEGGKFIEFEFDEETFRKENLLLYPDDRSSYAFLEKTTLNQVTKIESKPMEKESDTISSLEEASVQSMESDTASALNQFVEYTKARNLYYYPDDIFNFHACIKTGLLTILAGMSGTGKTRLPLEYARFFNMSEEKQTLLFVTVSPSYTEPSDVLGFYDPSSDNYIPSDTGLVSFLKHAKDNPTKMHMVIFDEMNLSRIEYWFAPFMSILERDGQDRVLHLYDKSLPCKNGNEFPSSISILDNIIFVGTINLDETTKELSDRLLDRSFVINLKKATFDRFSGSRILMNKNTPKYMNGRGELKRLFKAEDRSVLDYISVFDPKQREFFDEFDRILNESDSQKGISFRNARNIAIYLTSAVDGFNKANQVDGNEFSVRKAFDYAIHQTIMRKIRGPEEYIIDLVLTPDKYKDSKLYKLFDQYTEISDFELCKQDVKNKSFELKRFAYAR